MFFLYSFVWSILPPHPHHHPLYLFHPLKAKCLSHHTIPPPPPPSTHMQPHNHLYCPRLPNASNFCPAVQGTSQATPGVRSLCVEPRREDSERSLRWGGKSPEEGNQNVGPSKEPPIPWTSTLADASMSRTQEKEGRRNRSLQVPTRILQSVMPGLPHCPERDEIHQR